MAEKPIEELYEVPQIKITVPSKAAPIHRHTGTDLPKIKISDLEGFDYSATANLSGASKTVHFNIGGRVYYFKVYPTKTTIGGAAGTPENMTTYTEVDPGTDISTTALTASFTTIPRNVNAYLYKDYGVDYFNEDFTHYVIARVASGDANGNVGVWALANDLNSLTDLCTTLEDFLIVYVNQAAGSAYVYLQEYVGGAQTATDNSIALTLATDYYLKIVRSESVGTYGTLYCYIYSDEARTTLVDTLTITLTKKVDFRYIYGIMGFNDGDPAEITGYMKKLILS